MRLLIRNHFRNALDSIGANRARSLLTVIGIAIGVTSIVIILSLSGGVQKLVAGQIEAAGGNIIVIRPETSGGSEDLLTKLTTSRPYAGSSLTKNDVDAIGRLDNVSQVSPIAITEVTMRGDGEVPGANLVGTNSSLNEILQYPIKDGQFLTDLITGKTAVIGYTLALRLFDTTDAVGKSVRVKNDSLIVIGVLDRIDSPINYNNVDFDEALIVSAEHARLVDPNIQIQQIVVKTTTIDALGDVAEKIRESLLAVRGGEKNFSVATGDEISHPTGDLLDIVSSMLALVAGVSLIVGGIGVMNIMLVSVAERTREIGIRKAVGATNGHIMMQFLFESLILSLLGGLLGFAFGYAFSFGISLFTPFDPVITREIMIIALGIAVGIGCVFGIYPAAKAARKDPIESLRQYR